MIEFNKGLRLIGTDLWLDSTRTRPLGFISHAHGDHTGKHKEVISTPSTWSLCRRRIGDKRKTTLLNYGVSYSVDGLSIKLLPAGHMLGAAQILIENGQRVVYTGDFRLRPSRTAEAALVPPCDVLIMECTFGKPQYVFPEASEVERQLVEFIESAFEDRKVPVLLVYAMGKAQETLKFLGDKGYTVCLSKQIREVVKVYRSCGVNFRNDEPITGGEYAWKGSHDSALSGQNEINGKSAQ